MVLDARHRSSIYQKLVPLIGDDDTNALMTAFPPTEGDELVTKDFLRAELAEVSGGLRGEIATLEARLTMRIGAMGVAMVACMSALKLFA